MAPTTRAMTTATRAMAFAALTQDEQRIIFTQLCNTLDPRVAMAFSSASPELWALTQALRQQLRTDHQAATALCLKVGLRSCKELREAKEVQWLGKYLTAADLAMLGTLVLPALQWLFLFDASGAAGPDGVQRLVEGLGAGALPNVVGLGIHHMHVGNAGASELAAALGRGALPRLKVLSLRIAATDTGLVALAPTLRRLPALRRLDLERNPFGDEGIAALVAPPPAAVALSQPTGVLAKLERLNLKHTQVTDAGCAALNAALSSGALPALEMLDLEGIPASAAAQDAVYEAFNAPPRPYDFALHTGLRNAAAAAFA